MARKEGRKMVELRDGTRFMSPVHSYQVRNTTGFTDIKGKGRIHLVKDGEVWREEDNTNKHPSDQ